MRTCRFCAEQIQDAAIVCKHCGRDLSGQPALVKVDHNYRTLALIGIGLLFALLTLSYYGII